MAEESPLGAVVAVAVMEEPAKVAGSPVMENEAFPPPSVTTDCVPSSVSAWGFPAASRPGLAKIWTRTAVKGVLTTVPTTVVPAAEDEAELIAGAAWLSLPPGSRTISFLLA